MSEKKMNDLLEVIKEEVGYSEHPNGYSKFGEWYAENVDKDAAYKTAPWCDMLISWAAGKAGLKDSVGQFAYTVSHAQWFKEKDAWSQKPVPGALVFFDWERSKDIGGIDHVGVVEKVDGDKIHTIEGNIDGGNLKKKVREGDVIVGYGRPDKIAARQEAKKAEKKAESRQVDDGVGFAGTHTSGTRALTGTSSDIGFVPAGNTMGDPGQVVLSGLLVALVAMMYVLGVLAKARVPALVAQAKTIPARAVSTWLPALWNAILQLPALIAGHGRHAGTGAGWFRRPGADRPSPTPRPRGRHRRG